LFSIFKGITNSNQKKIKHAIAQAAKGQLTSLNIELLKEKETFHKYNFSFTPISDPKGKILAIVAEYFDIKSAYTPEIQLNYELLKAFFNDASIGLAVLNHKWQHVIINKTLADINGKPVEQHIGKAVREIIPNLAPQLEAIYKQIQTTGEPVYGIKITGETPRKEGFIGQWEASYFPLSVSQNPDGIGCVVLEVTEREKAQKSLTTRLKQQAAVAQLGQLALSGIELPDLFNQTTALVIENLEVDSCKILELLPGKNNLLLRSCLGCEEDVAGQTTVEADSKSQAGYALLSGKPVILDNLNEETRFTGSSLLHKNQYISGISTIIPGKKNQYFGVLEAHSTLERQFIWDDVNFLQSIANILSTAITRKQAEDENRELNATLESRVQERTKQLESIQRSIVFSKFIQTINGNIIIRCYS
ncbi:MAG: PAS domain-containing protein, partial [Rivularia sp. ALOHA_DT_140]|nr:PAS domain-containing protein [Rivularia sp. ALOHA_DT_140]